MKKTVVILLLLMGFSAFAQDKKIDIYSSLSTEMIFSFANIDNQGSGEGNIIRWAPVINPQWMINFDMNRTFGLFSGLAVRNVGFIYENPADSNGAKYKYRTYNLGIPVGIKLGKLNNFLFFGGYEIEFPFVYKEKKFVNENKEEKNVNWFSGKVEPVQHSLMAGIQFPFGATLKFKYYLSNFHKQSYHYTSNGQQVYPYKDLNANVFYFSLAWNVFTGLKDYIPGK